MGAFAGAVIGSAFSTRSAAGRRDHRCGAGHPGGAEARSRLVAANGGGTGRCAIAEDVVAVGGGFLVAFLVSLLRSS